MVSPCHQTKVVHCASEAGDDSRNRVAVPQFPEDSLLPVTSFEPKTLATNNMMTNNTYKQKWAALHAFMVREKYTETHTQRERESESASERVMIVISDNDDVEMMMMMMTI